MDSLSDRCRCLAPDWPIGSQPMAMKPDADLSPYGIAATIASFLEELDLEDVTIVGNDSGGAMSQVLVDSPPGADRPPRSDQLRHPRELPAGAVQGDAPDCQDPRRNVAPGRPSGSRGGPRGLQALRPKRRSPPSWSAPGWSPASTTPASGAT